MRWPMDWTFTEWGVAFLTLLAGFVLFVFAVPAGVVVGCIAYLTARRTSRLLNPEAPGVYFRVVLGSFLLFSLVVSLNPATWLRPLWWPLAVLLSLVTPFIAIRLYGNWIDWNRPVAYWIRLPRLVARGPRQVPAETTDPTPLTLGIDPASANTDRDYVVTKPKPPVRATISHAKRKRIIQKVPGGWLFRGTIYRIEWRTF